MKNLSRIMSSLIVLTAASAWTVLADTPTPVATHSSGNQLMQGQTHWYEKGAETVGSVEGLTAKGGTLLALQKGSFLYMNGDSTLHQYQMRAGTLKGSAIVKGTLSGGLEKALKAGKVGSMTLIIPVETFKSRETGLDNNAYKALKTDKNPEIKFVLEKATFKAGDKEGSYVMTAKGKLTVAGETAPITLTANAVIAGDKIEIKGDQKLKMSDFKVTPPSVSLLITAITCSDQIDIYFDVFFAPVGEANSEAKK